MTVPTVPHPVPDTGEIAWWRRAHPLSRIIARIRDGIRDEPGRRRDVAFGDTVLSRPRPAPAAPFLFPAAVVPVPDGSVAVGATPALPAERASTPPHRTPGQVRDMAREHPTDGMDAFADGQLANAVYAALATAMGPDRAAVLVPGVVRDLVPALDAFRGRVRGEAAERTFELGHRVDLLEVQAAALRRELRQAWDMGNMPPLMVVKTPEDMDAFKADWAASAQASQLMLIEPDRRLGRTFGALANEVELLAGRVPEALDVGPVPGAVRVLLQDLAALVPPVPDEEPCST